MKKGLLLTLIFLVFTAIAIKIFFFSGKLSQHPKEENVSSENFRFVTDVGYYYFTSHESKITTQSNFLNKDILEKLPLKLGDWKGENVPHQFPNLVHYRLYINQKTKDVLWFISVYGTHQSQFHTAEVCYISDGWDVSNRTVYSIKMDSDEFRARYMKAMLGKTTHIGLYWYMWQNSRRRMQDGAVMFRLSIEKKGTDEEALEGLLDFVHELKKVSIR